MDRERRTSGQCSRVPREESQERRGVVEQRIRTISRMVVRAASTAGLSAAALPDPAPPSSSSLCSPPKFLFRLDEPEDDEEDDNEDEVANSMLEPAPDLLFVCVFVC